MQNLKYSFLINTFSPLKPRNVQIKAIVLSKHSNRSSSSMKIPSYIRKYSSLSDEQWLQPRRAMDILEPTPSPIPSTYPVNPTRKQAFDLEWMNVSPEALEDALLDTNPPIAWSIFKSLKENQPEVLATLYPTIYTRLLQMFSAHISPKMSYFQALSVWNSMKLNDIVPDRRDYHALLYLLIRTGRRDAFDDTWNSFVQQIKPNLADWKLRLAMDASKADLLAGEQHFQAMLGISSSILPQDSEWLDVDTGLALDPLVLDAEVFAIMLELYARTKSSMIIPFFADMILVFGIRPDRRVMDTLLGASYVRGIDWQQLRETSETALTHIVNNSLIFSRQNLNNWFIRHVSQLTTEVKQDKERVNSVQIATETLEWYTELYGIAPGLESYNAIIRMCSMSQDLDSALSWFQKMRLDFPNTPPFPETFENLISLFVRKDENMDRAMELFTVMQQAHVEPTPEVYKTLIVGHFNNRDYVAVDSLVKEIEQKKLKLTDPKVEVAIQFVRGN